MAYSRSLHCSLTCICFAPKCIMTYIILTSFSLLLSLNRTWIERVENWIPTLVYYANERHQVLDECYLLLPLFLYSLFSGTPILLFALTRFFFFFFSFVFSSSPLCPSFLQIRIRVEMRVGNVHVACDLWRSRFFARIWERRRRRRKRTRRQKQSSRIRVTCDSLCI